MNAAFSYASLVRSDSNKTRGRESAGWSRFPGTQQAAPLNTPEQPVSSLSFLASCEASVKEQRHSF